MKKTKLDWVFECRKCVHQVYVPKEKVHEMLDFECPNCGEESDRLWILIGEGIYEDIK